MKTYKLLLILVCFAQITGCSTTRGPAIIVDADGIAFDESKHTHVTSLYKRFNSSAKKASTAQATPVEAYQANIQSVLLDGTALVHATCGDFFTTAGETQVWLVFAKDATAGVAAIATGLLTLHGASKNSIANVAFGSTAVYAGIDSYTKDFLFAADNIESVRELTMKALDAHRGKLLEMKMLDVATAMTLIQDNQDVCSPRSIARLAKAAIASGTVTASTSPEESLARLAQISDAATMQRVGDTLGLSGGLSSSQQAALYWLVMESPTSDEQNRLIAPLLVDIKAVPFDSDGKNPPTFQYNDGKWTFGTKIQIRNLFSTLSAARVSSIDLAIMNTKAAAKDKPTLDTMSVVKILRDTQVGVVNSGHVFLKVNGLP